jgi:DeoR/GlpR family transcriptional regulator of sugar metabolism
VLAGRDGAAAWRFVFDARDPAVSSGRVSVYRGTLLREGAFPVPAVAKVLEADAYQRRVSAVRNAGMALMAGAGPSFCYSGCDAAASDVPLTLAGKPVLVEEDGGLSLKDALADPCSAVPGPGAGRPLFAPAERRPVREAVARKVFFDLLAHLRALHRYGYAHGDVRPSNVVVRRYGQRPQDVRATLVDFESLVGLDESSRAFVNEYRAAAEKHFGREPAPREADLYGACMVYAQLLDAEPALTGQVEARGRALLSRHFAGLGDARSSADVDVLEQEALAALAAELDVVPVAGLPTSALPGLNAACGYIDYLGLRDVRERDEDGWRCVSVRPVPSDAAAARAELLDELASLVTNCAYELRDRNGGRVTLDLVAPWLEVHGFDASDLARAGFSALGQALRALCDAGRIPGIEVGREGELRLVAEHTRAKQRINGAGKQRIAAYALDVLLACLREGHDFRLDGPRAPKTVFVDGGTTTGDVVDALCDLIAEGAVSGLRVVTPSVRHAARISECFMDRGLGDGYDAVALYMAGGLVRPGTQSTISEAVGLGNQVEKVGHIAAGGRRGLRAHRFDLAFVGASRLSSNGLVTTVGGTSAENKHPALAAARALVLLDATKLCDPPLAYELCSLAHARNLTVVTDADQTNSVFAQLAATFPDRVVGV